MSKLVQTYKYTNPDLRRVSIKLNFDRTSKDIVTQILQAVKPDTRSSAPALQLFGNLDPVYLEHYRSKLREIAAEQSAFRIRMINPFQIAQLSPTNLTSDESSTYGVSLTLRSNILNQIHHRLSQVPHFSTQQCDSRPFTEKYFFNLCDGLSKSAVDEYLCQLKHLFQKRVRLQVISFRIQEHLLKEDAPKGQEWTPLGEPRFIPLMSAGAQRYQMHRPGGEWKPRLRHPELDVPVRWSPYVESARSSPRTLLKPYEYKRST